MQPEDFRFRLGGGFVNAWLDQTDPLQLLVQCLANTGIQFFRVQFNSLV